MVADLSIISDPEAPDTDDLMAGLEAVEEARVDYVKAKKYAEGTQPEFFASIRLRRALQRTGTNFRINLARKAITAVTDRMEIAGVTVPDNEALTKILLEDVWDANDLSLEAPTIHFRSCQDGDGYVFVWPGDEPGTVDIEYSGAEGTRAIYDPEHPRRILYVIKTWTEGAKEKKIHRANLYYFGNGTDDGTGRIEKWVTAPGSRAEQESDWSPYTLDGEPWPIINPHGQIVFHFRTSRPYGVPLHKDAFGPQDALNKLVITQMATTDHQGFPIRYLLTDPSVGEEGDDAVEDFDDDFDNPEDVPVDPRFRDQFQRSKLRSGPGEAWILDGIKSVGQFQAADPHVFLDPSDFFIRMMATTTDTPLHFYDPGGDQPSGDSRRTAEGTLTKKIEAIQLSFEATWSRLLAKALQILGHGDVGRVDVRWAPVASQDDVDGWTTAAAKIAAGVPVRQVLLEMGYVATQVDGWLADSSEQDLARKIELLAQMSVALQALGTASTLGVVGADQVQQIVDSFLPNIEGEQTT